MLAHGRYENASHPSVGGNHRPRLFLGKLLWASFGAIADRDGPPRRRILLPRKCHHDPHFGPRKRAAVRGVEDRGLAAAARAEEGGEGREGLQLQVAERPVVLDPDRFDPRDGMAGAFLVGHGRDSEGWFYGISAQISFGRILSREF